MSVRDDALKVWDEAWTEGLWHAPWSKALEGLSPAQVVWLPQPGRHSIWQIIEHVMFWREVAVRRAGGETVGDEEYKQRNYQPNPAVNAADVNELRRRFEFSHKHVREALADESRDVQRLTKLAYHDSYHIGQVMLLRGLQGLPPLD